MAERRRITVRTLIGTVAAVAILPLCVLFGVGWRLREQDRSLAAQQIAQRVERAADIVVAALQRPLAASRERLAAGARDWPPGAVAIVVTGARFEASPRGRLAWLPEVRALPQAPAAAVAEGEGFEFQKTDLPAAEGSYRQLASSSDQAKRAAGSVRLARVLRAQDRAQEALEAYRSMEGLDEVALDSVPASLVALHARSELLAELGRGPEARQVSSLLRQRLASGKWELTRAVYQLYSGEPRPEQEMLARAAEELHREWKQRPPAPTGARLIQAGGETVAVIHQTPGREIRALLATAAFVEAQWWPAARAAAEGQRVRLTLGRAEGTLPAAWRKAGETSLPWDVAVASADPEGEVAQLTGRQRLLEAGFLLLAALILAAALFTIRALRRELEVSRLQSEFVSAVSHEFRTPLTSLRQFTEMLRDGRELSEARRQLSYEAQARAADRLTRLVESLLDFSQLEAGVRPYRMERCDAEGLVRRVVEDFSSEMAPSGRTVQLKRAAPGQIEADPEALGRALWNLLDNAVKYSPGREIIEAGLERRDGQIAIFVRDHGLGIPRPEQQVIFARFRRGAQASKLGIKGTGIGLAMVEHIVKAHQGSIELESEPGRGSCFTIVLPVKE